jgi:peptide/nickel transport system permease protein
MSETALSSPRRRISVGLSAGAIVTGLFVAIALGSFAWTPYDVTAFDIPDRLGHPSWSHWLGTDQFGRDMVSMIMVGGRNSLAVALSSALIGAVVGVPLGLLAAARRGFVEELVMRANDVIFAFPAVLLAILLAAVLGPSALNAVIAIGVFNIPVFARVVRGAALSQWSRDYVLAARLAGKSLARISLEHILPNILGILIAQATIQVSIGIIAEAGLSYIGLGVQPPLPSWGRMLNEAQTLIGIDPSLAVVPGLAILFAVMGFNLLGDGLRDLADPRTRGAR